ncbi:carbohydrate kinase family protein [Cohnella lupini]|uniref:Sugar/nucleoside kinase (Ribokinase family) n=1 Tax=Cohnella lupini TaxID=1294267 RepID=A0A3D9I1S4_9BACL|nr:carbohydrate kinase family protein [Cohnella lupini]RED55694.1 sugar/nucleoside kinase (ribokinase family) [Cohnella lupini]
MNKNVYILGELNVDMILKGRDVVPEWNKEKLLDSFDIVLGSSSAITASGLSGLGLNVYMVSVVGDDQLGHFCIDQLRERGVDTRYVTIDKTLKTGVTVSLSTEKDRALLTYMGAIPHLRPEHLPKELFTAADHIHFGSYFLQEDMRTHWLQVFKEASAANIGTSFDTGWDIHEQWYPDLISELLEYTTFFIPSEDELMRIYPAEQLDEALVQLPVKRNIVAVKRGSKGAVMLDRQGNRTWGEPFPVTPIDTTGAGDSFNAGLIYRYLTGGDSREMLDFACACGALATLRIGGASAAPSVEEVRSFMKGR